MSTNSFRHEALFYDGQADYVRRTGDFIEDAVNSGEPILVVVSAEKIELLRRRLGRRASKVRFADMAGVGLNPARIIPAWQEFVEDAAVPGQRLRGIGEPIWAARAGEELVECQRHEALLNVAFDDVADFWLLCPYDLKLAPAVLDEAQRSHQYLADSAGHHTSAAYSGGGNPTLHAPLPELGQPAAEVSFAATSLGAVRRLVSRHAARAGFPPERIADVTFAANEVATNSIRHGGGTGRLRIWRDAGALVCEVCDSGTAAPALADRRRPGSDIGAPRGLWLANQLCDLVQLRSFTDGNAVRVHLRAEPSMAAS